MVFSWQYCEVFKNSYFEEHLWTLLLKVSLFMLVWTFSYMNKKHNKLLRKWRTRSSYRRCSVRKGVLRNFAGKHMCKSLSFNKVAGCLQRYLKRGSTKVLSCEFCEISKNTFFMEHTLATASEKDAFPKSKRKKHSKSQLGEENAFSWWFLSIRFSLSFHCTSGGVSLI